MHPYKEEAAKSHKEKTHRLSGGSAHSDEAADRALVHKMVKPKSLTGKASGGKAKGKGSKVNILIAPHESKQAVPVPVGQAGPNPVMPSPRVGPATSPMPPMPSKSPMTPGLGGLGGLGSKRGGKISHKHKMHGGAVHTGGAGGARGRIEK